MDNPHLESVLRQTTVYRQIIYNVCSQINKKILQIERKIDKDPYWWEADQLVIYIFVISSFFINNEIVPRIKSNEFTQFIH